MCDGYDVLVAIDGQHEVVHFADQPPDVAAAVDAWVAARPVVQYEVISE